MPSAKNEHVYRAFCAKTEPSDQLEKTRTKIIDIVQQFL